MRKFLFFAVALFQFQFAISQEISGIGFLKVGQTTIAALDSLISTGYKLRNSSDFMEYYRPSGKIILQPIRNDKEKYFHFASNIPEQKIFKIGTLTIANIKIENIELKFYRDTLFSININNYGIDFTNALKLKYGDPEIKTEKKDVKCVGKIAGEYTVQDVAYTSSYPAKGGLKAYDFLHKYYDDHCEEQIIHFFLIDDEGISKIVRKLESAEDERNKKSEDAQKLKSLKGF